MAITHDLLLSLSVGGNSVSKTVSATSGQELNVEETIPDPSTDLNVAFAAVRAKLKSFYMVADQAVTVETNDGTTPDNTFSLSAGVPVIWYPNIGIGINTFLAADITSLKLTNASGEDAALKIRAVIDPT